MCQASLDNQTLSVRVLLLQPSCLEGSVSVRDSATGRMVRRVGFFDQQADEFAFNTTGPDATVEIEQAAPTMPGVQGGGCRINLEMDVITVGKSL